MSNVQEQVEEQVQKKRFESIFKSLPKVEKIWVTKDGHFHLHNVYGGDLVTRESILPKEKPGQDLEL